MYSRTFGMRLSPESSEHEASSVLHSDEISTSQKFFIGNLSLPSNSEKTTEASLVEGVNFLILHVGRVHVSLCTADYCKHRHYKQPTLYA